MIRRFAVLLGVVTLVTLIAPPSASAEQQPFLDRSPAGGPPGGSIGVSGYCPPFSTVLASLRYRTYSDGIPPDVDSRSTSADTSGRYALYLTNRTTKADIARGPVELEVRVRCYLDGADWFMTKPFISQRNQSNVIPRLYTVQGQGACGIAFAPTYPPIACPAYLKGFATDGLVANVSDYVWNRGWGGTIALGNWQLGTPLQAAVATGPGPETEIALNAFAPPDQRTDLVPFPGFTGGVSMAAGNIVGDSHDELIVGANAGGGPHVKVFAFNGSGWDLVRSFYAYSPAFRGGVSVAAADLDGDGVAELVTGAGPGGSPHVRVFNGAGTPISGFYAYAPAFSGGVNVAAGRLGDNPSAQIVTAPGEGGGPHIRTFDGNGQPVGPGFYAYDKNFHGAISVAVGYAESGGASLIATAPLSGGGPHVRLFTNSKGDSSDKGFYAYSVGWNAGAHVALFNQPN